MAERMLLLRGGLLVDGDGAREGDLLVHDGTIAATGAIEASPAIDAEVELVDARGMLVLPGGVDEHVHPNWLDDVPTVTRAAAAGGTTTTIHFAFADAGRSLLAETQAAIDEGRDASAGDFAVHPTTFDAEAHERELDDVFALGIRSLKVFTAYPELGRMTPAAGLLRLMRAVAERDGIVLVHAENGDGIRELEREHEAGRLPGADAAARWSATRPPQLEQDAVATTAGLAELTGCRTMIVHVTCDLAAQQVALARGRGVPLVAETCPHYLSLTDDALRARGALAKIGPPLRSARDRDALWEHVRAGTISTIGSDHAPFKDITHEHDELLAAGFGAPAAESMLPITWEDGVGAGRLSPVEWVRLVSEHPARVFGLWPRKGSLRVGADADLVLWDPAARRTLTDAGQSRAGYNLYAGREVSGGPSAVWVRGTQVVRDGALLDGVVPGRFTAMGTPDVLLG